MITVAEAAERLKVSPQMVRILIKRGLIEGAIKRKNRVGLSWYEMPARSVQKLAKQYQGRIPRKEYDTTGRRKLKPPSSEAEARQRFDANQKSDVDNRKVFISYDELKEMYATNERYQVIGDALGVTRQRAHQIYQRYFEPWMLPSGERSRIRTEEIREERCMEDILSVDKMAKLKDIAESLDFEFKPLRYNHKNWKGNHGLALVGGRVCNIHISEVASLVSPVGYRKYYRFHLTRPRMEACDFVILMTGSDCDRVFIIPSKTILQQFDEETKFKQFFVPTEKYPVYNNNPPRIDWWRFLEAWDQLEKRKK